VFALTLYAATIISSSRTMAVENARFCVW